jgi:nucleoside diphosphate kinase
VGLQIVQLKIVQVATELIVAHIIVVIIQPVLQTAHKYAIKHLVLEVIVHRQTVISAVVQILLVKVKLVKF